MNVHCFQHVPFEGLAYIETWLAEHTHQTGYTRFYEPDHRLPALESIDALIVMGGPMGVYDDAEYPWLQKEKTFITNAIKAKKKVLGICLGAQLIACCSGASITKAAHKEIGWFSIYPTPSTERVPWFYNLVINNPLVFHWHGDSFDIPPGAVHLASSVANANQAFMLDNHILGLQFHCEITPSSVKALLKNCSTDLQNGSFVQPEENIWNASQSVKPINDMMDTILCNFLH